MSIATQQRISLTLSRNQKKILVQFAYDPRLVSLVKQVDGRKWDADNRRWTIPTNSYRQLKLLATKHGVGLMLSPMLMDAVQRGEAAREELVEARDAEDAPLELPTGTVPFDFQRAGIHYLQRSLAHFHGVLLADDMGLGKTFQALSVVALEGWEPVLVLCPASLKYNWEAEVKKHYPEMTVQVVDGSADQRRLQWTSGARITIANYDLLIRDPEPLLFEWDCLIADEATALKNHKAQRTKKTKEIATKKMMALSGMPLENRLSELHSIMDLAMPGLLGTYWQFLSNYALRDAWGTIVGSRNLETLVERIKPHYLRRKKEDVLTDLPPKVYNDVLLELSNAEWKMYDSLTRQIRSEIEENPKLSVQNILTMMLRLKQLTSAARLLDEDWDKDETKLSALDDILEAAQDQKVVVFTEFAELATALSNKYDGHLIRGSVSSEDRAEIIKSFQTDDKKVLVSTDAGAYGLTITAASIVIHVDQPWNPARARQREDRLHRIGQTESVQVINLLTRRTIDGRIRELMTEKLALAGAVLEEDTIPDNTKLTRDDLLSMLGGRDEE